MRRILFLRFFIAGRALFFGRLASLLTNRKKEFRRLRGLRKLRRFRRLRGFRELRKLRFQKARRAKLL
jgi:hypothetical protein